MEALPPIRGLIRQSVWLLRIAGLLVPKERRKEWFEKRCADVWHWAHFLQESGRLNATTRLELARYVWSAFLDAAWQRWNRETVLKLIREGPRSPRFCLLAIAGVFLIVVTATGFAPTIRTSFSRMPYRDPERLAHLAFNDSFLHIRSDSLFTAANHWKEKSRTAEAISAYSWEASTIADHGSPVDVISARVSPNFFDTLGVGAGMGRLFRAGDDGLCPDCIVLSNHLWQYAFHRDPAILGKRVSFRGRTATVIGVLPRSFWFTSPEVSVWSLIDFRPDAITSAARAGVVIRLRPGATMNDASGEFSKFVSATSSIDLTSIKTRVRQGTQIYLLFTLLALVGSLGVLGYRLVNAGAPKVPLSRRDRYRWWLFFVAKTILLLADCFVISLEGTRRVFLFFNGVVPPFAGPVCTWLFLVTTVLALMWSLHDQGRRCRRCLRRLGNEISVGAPAYLLLDWWGTELVCSQGHGMLHVPEMQASWLEVEHWTPLDDSWKPLFQSKDVKA